MNIDVDFGVKHFVVLYLPMLDMLKKLVLGYYKIGNYSPTKMLCTKIHIYNHFLVDWNANQLKSIALNTEKMRSKIFLFSSQTKLPSKPRLSYRHP